MLFVKNLPNEAHQMQQKLTEIRHYLHSHAETGFHLTNTCQYIQTQLKELGYTPIPYGKSGFIAICNENAVSSKKILLRADMDALPIREESGLAYQSENGSMHACGHDIHATMLLGAAALLKKHEKELNGQVILCFQPAEELLEGARDMMEAGLFEDTNPDYALMLHTTVGLPLETGSLIVCDGGVSAPAADYFTIQFLGKGCHGAMPHLGKDPITAATHFLSALEVIHARELSMFDEAVLTIGSIHAGQSANVIPDSLTLQGTLRAYDDEVHTFLKNRLQELATQTSHMFGTTAKLSFTSGCPTLLNDPFLSQKLSASLKDFFGTQKVLLQSELLAASHSAKTTKAVGSEDFAYFSHKIPSLMIAIASGQKKDGYEHPLHHPKVRFDEAVLPYGALTYAYSAMCLLADT